MHKLMYRFVATTKKKKKKKKEIDPFLDTVCPSGHPAKLDMNIECHANRSYDLQFLPPHPPSPGFFNN